MTILKFNAHTVMKNIFFQGANYLEPTKYEEQYNNEICERENEEIKRIINSNIDSDINLLITDIGCGTGLGSDLLDERHQYVGVDRSQKSIEYCRKHKKRGTFIKANAENIVKEVKKINPIFIFSIDYLSVKTISEFIKKTDKIFIAVHYNKPYLSQTSVYSGRSWLYRLIHPKRKRNAMYALFERHNAKTFKLLDEDYYYVTIIKKD